MSSRKSAARQAVFLSLGLLLGLSGAGCGGGGGSSSGGGNDLALSSANLTLEAVQALLHGDDDFAALSAKLQAAIDKDPQNDAPRLFKAFTDFLLFLKETSGAPGGIPGKFNDLFTRAGYVNIYASGSFWEFQLEEIAHGQGSIIDTAPHAGEWFDFLINDLRPQIENVIAALDAVPKNFLFAIDVDAEGSFFDDDPFTNDLTPFWLDYGDVRILKSTVQLLVVPIDFVYAYDHDNLVPNDFDRIDYPQLDPLALIDTQYPNLLKLARPAEMQNARLLVETAWYDYKEASEHIRNENPQEQDNGLFTLGRNVFENQAELLAFLQDEANFRMWTEAIVNAFTVNSGFTIDRDLDLVLIPPDEQFTINFYELWLGVSFRDIFFKIIDDPFDNDKTLGVTNLADLTDAMATYSDVFLAVGGRRPGPGDLQEVFDGDDESFYTLWSSPGTPWRDSDGGNGLHPQFAIAVNPPIETKIIDGLFGDWPGNALRISESPKIATRFDVGDVYVAKDANNLYIWIDEDLTAYMPGSWGNELNISVESRNGLALLSYNFWAGFQFQNMNYETSSVPGGGIEIEVSLSDLNDTWAEIKVRVDAEGAGYEIYSFRSRMFVDLR